ncbi:protein toll-like [Polistes fuscatus]|uniref:protein toll-like n=1 Tax=Polistes fuscatus TaxID=30207 RepID=UPI001CA9BEED|nr:protein toll-like [Polistes fuscatus]
MICNVHNSTKYTIYVKSRDYLQIVCTNWKGWEDFNFTSKLPGKIINSVEFKHCGVSNKISLKNVVERLGVEKTETLIFQSSKFLYDNLKEEHLRGFPNVTKLVLAGNGMTFISSDFFDDLTELEWIDLSDNRLILPIDIFDLTPNVKRLELSRNGLKSIIAGIFYDLKNLEFLNLMENELKELPAEIFVNLVPLKTLNLRQNELSELPEKIFEELEKLETLDISFNKFTYIQSKLFDHNKVLRQLFFHHNKLDLYTLPDYLLSNLTKLEEVYLNNNGLTKLPTNLFWNSTSLKYINLNSNYLKTLPQNIFQGIRNLEVLSISNNMIKTLPRKIFKDIVNLDKLDLSKNDIVYITRDLLDDLTFLTELNMESNHLMHIPEKALKSLLNLRIAKFSNNLLIIDNSTKWCSLRYNLFLEELHLSYNDIEFFISDWSKHGHYLRLLDLSHNKIRTVSKHDIDVIVDRNPISCDCQLYDLLRYRENKISSFNYNYFHFTLKNLSCIHTNGMTGPLIRNLNSTTYKCNEHEYFNIKRKCQNDCTCSVRPSDMTRILDCSNNNMNKFVLNETMVDFEQNYPLILNLTGNFLTEIPSFKSLKPINITGLLLSNNQISQITIDKLPDTLTILELHNNKISEIEIKVLAYVYSRSLKVFTLSGNPIKCDCDTRFLLYFVQTKRFDYNDLDNLKCKDVDLPLYQMTNEQLINCINWKRWNDLNFTSKLSSNMVKTVKFKNCGISNEISLKDVVTKLGVEETEALIFHSNEILYRNLYRSHLRGFSNVKQLVLSGNGLTYLNSDFFENFTNLEWIDLSDNRLKFPDDIFDYTKNIKRLELSGNGLGSKDIKILYELDNLEFLNLMGNKLKELQPDPTLLTENIKLRQLRLHNNDRFLYTLPEDIFKNLENLEEVYLNNNGLQILPENIFYYSRSLKYINLDGDNRIRTLPDKIFQDMINLEKLNLSRNDIANISRDLFAGLTFLTELNMERNEISYIEETALNSLQLLKIADFTHNKLIFDRPVCYCNNKRHPFRRNLFLEELHLSYNDIEFLFRDWSESEHYLRLLNLSHNKIRTVKEKEKKYLYFDNLFNLDIFLFTDHNPILCDCQLYDLLRFRDNKLPNFYVRYFNFTLGNLSCINPDGSKGPIIKYQDSFTYACPEDEYFNISKNCQTGCDCKVRLYDNTRILDCSYRKMSKFLIDQTKVKLIEGYTLIVNLTGNFLTEIPSVRVLEAMNVTGLLLSNNDITKITIHGLPETLKVLELHNNDISEFKLNEFSYIYSRVLDEFTLRGNPFTCDCSIRELIYLIKRRRFLYKDLENLECDGLPMYKMSEEMLKCPKIFGISIRDGMGAILRRRPIP